MPALWIFLICYLCLINLSAAIAACIDKSRAKRGKWRVAESTLLWLGFFGGALLEWLVMRCIRHKTTRKKFMIGLPLMAVFHGALCGCLFYFIL